MVNKKKKKVEDGAKNKADQKTENKWNRLVPVVITVQIIGGVIYSLLFGDLNKLIQIPQSEVECPVPIANSKPTYILYNADGRRDHLKHVIQVLNRFGYEEAVSNSTNDWNLIWAHDYPFNTLKTFDLKNLKPCQKVNHLPGCGFITNKVDLSTTKLKYIPKAFKLPAQEEELREFAKDHPSRKFVQKHNQHRHIKVKSLEEIDFKDETNFVQEFIDNPLLVDGFKFDIGVYTMITSIDPLRAYIYSGDVLFRFCPVKYYPFDPLVVDKYIVGDDYLPIWKVPSLSVFYNNLKHGMKESFDGYLRSENRDPEIVWRQVEEAIRLMLLNKEKLLKGILDRYRNKRSFFELMRIDFVVDNDLNVFLMEANMSPNLSSAHFPPNQLLYEQVLYNTLKLAGVAFPQQNKTCSGNPQVNRMMTSDKNIVINQMDCSTAPCLESCAPIKCAYCYPCLDEEDKTMLNDAVTEHLNRGDTRRIFPPTMDIIQKMTQEEFGGLSENNQFMLNWFKGKCEASPSWCN